ncbi:related to DNA topoisomerase II binding protein [Melanopsichium pennsylvanicum]|uniref:Related to DNA topoisomerase II binding protein n=2 Tax=Melanopsichium pennsylvanicum TaxID=63383 RepID=A0AAJ5C2K8_9BASI|nr:related to DNA topoisomerase II binding protein [Melanopsichium pennsylvanicum 4]SNX81602.1 related to DNA topoisomerase II binding protein [Melanopsichium pennsylvanicum]
MNRSAKAHRSTKIPNVKLRPAQSGSTTPHPNSSYKHKRSRQSDELLDHREDAAHFRQLRDDGHDQGAHLDADFIGSSAHPLKGAIISITGLVDAKPALTNYARELGARVEANLTEDVTHLIADRPGSEKYRFALELGMHIVSPEWIHDVRDAWLAGQDVDAQELEDRHQLPALSNTTICFSALGGTQRRALVALAKQLGATVSDELRFDGTITHLVSATADPNASSSVHHLLHFLDRSRHGRNGTREHAASRILAVRPEWLDDCHKAQGCLSEQIYSIFATLPHLSQRETLIQKARTKLPSPFVRDQQPATVPFQSPFVASNPSSLAFAEFDSPARDGHDGVAMHQQDEDDEQPITLGSRQKAAAAAEKSFGNILSQLRGNPSTTVTPSSLQSHAAKPATFASASDSTKSFTSSLAPIRTSESTSAPIHPQRNSLLGMSRASSFSPAPHTTNAPAPLSMRKASCTKLVTLPHSSQASSTQTSGGDRCFHGKSFKICLNDPHRKKVLAQVLKDNGATLLDFRSATSSDFVVVETKASVPSIHALIDAGHVPVLHFWIEYCLHHETFVKPDTYFAALPAQVALPLPEAVKLRLLLLGFEPESPELYHAQKLVADMGGSIAKQLTGESLTHVVCATQESFDGKRAQRARSRGVPVVGLEFLIKARQTGRLAPPPVPIAVSENWSSAMTNSTSSSSNATDHKLDDLQEHENDDASALPLAGCIVSRSKVLISQSVMLERKVLQLGACWQAVANETTTHLLHKSSGAPRESKDLGPGAFIVHPNWLDKCLEQGIRVDESLFPFSMNPSKSLLTVLSSSDGSARGNFLSQASQSPMQNKHASQGSQQTQTQAELVAAAKPWHRSISADAARHSIAAQREDETRPARGRSEEIDAMQEDHVGDIESAELVSGVNFDADVTLSGDVSLHHVVDAEHAPPAPSSQTLIEGEVEDRSGAAFPEVRGPSRKEPDEKFMDPPVQLSVVRSAKHKIASADEVMELLRSRTLAQGTRKKGRLPPRARKQRSDQHEPQPHSGEGVLPPEEVLEAQAQLDAQRAAEAAAQGYSLDMDKDVALAPNSQSGQSFDASVRIVYDDPAAMRERNRLMKMLEHQQPVHAIKHFKTVREMDGSRDQSEGSPEESSDAAAEEDGCRKRGAEDTLGAGRHSRRYYETRNGESPTKRPVVRRQPLARR